MAESTVRTLRDDEREEASRVVNYGMLGSLDAEVSEAWGKLIDASRAHGAFSADGALVGLARWFQADLTVPGGEVPAAGVTAVAVLSTHRRQGHLSRMMRSQLAAIADEEVPIALLVAAEWPIYGRFGYGPAIDACALELDAAVASFPVEPTGSIELVRPAALRPHLEAAHEARRLRTPGAITRDSDVWDVLAGVVAWPGQKLDVGKLRGAVWRDDSGAVQGAVVYKVEEVFTHNRPDSQAEVILLVGATPEAERELWRHLCEIDWVRTVKAGDRGIDDPLPLFLADGRAARHVDQFDCIWARVLDVSRVLGPRRPPVADEVVVEVVDPLGFASGRWSLQLGPDGSEVNPTTSAADVTLPVHALGAACLGGRSMRRLHEAGWLDEETADAVDRLDGMLTTPSKPWSPTTY